MSSTASSLLLHSAVGGVRYLTLNQPQTRNALSLTLIQLINRQLTDIRKDKHGKNADEFRSSCCLTEVGQLYEFVFNPSCFAFCLARVVVFRSTGPAFSSGHNLREVSQMSQSQQRTLFDECAEMMCTIQELEQPVIAQVQGIATAAGCQLVRKQAKQLCCHCSLLRGLISYCWFFLCPGCFL